MLNNNTGPGKGPVYFRAHQTANRTPVSPLPHTPPTYRISSVQRRTLAGGAAVVETAKWYDVDTATVEDTTKCYDIGTTTDLRLTRR